MFAVNPNKDWLLQLSEKFKNKKFVSFNNKSFTAEELLAKRNEVCGILKNFNISRGSKVAIISQNTIDFVVELFAVWALGAVPVPINIRQNEDEIIEQLKYVEAELVFADFGDAKRTNLFSQFNVIQSAHLKDEKKLPVSINWEINLNSTALLMFTSGSSGTPKCVELTFQNLFHSAQSVIELVKPAITDCWSASLPFYHIGGFSIIIRSFLSGNKMIIQNSNSAETIAASLKSGEANFISLVPTTLLRLLNAKIIPHKNIKAIFLGGGCVTLSLVKKALQNGYKIITVYGSTETASMIAADKLTGKKNSSSFAGKPLTGTEYFILDEFENRVSANKVGEIAVKSPSIAKGYFNNPKETNIKFKRNNKHKLDYYLTSDLGKMDKQGRLFILGRKDDVIISGGENISTSEVTDKIKSLKEVGDVFAFGLPDEQWGEKLIAAIVLRKSSGRELENQLKELLPGYKLPKEIFFVNEIPRTSLGKVIKKKLLPLLK